MLFQMETQDTESARQLLTLFKKKKKKHCRVGDCKENMEVERL